MWAVSLCVQSINILSQRKTLYSYGQRGLPMCHRVGTYELHGEAVQTRASRLPLKQYPLKMATRSPPWLPLQRVFIVVVICRLLLLKGSGHRFPPGATPVPGGPHLLPCPWTSGPSPQPSCDGRGVALLPLSQGGSFLATVCVRSHTPSRDAREKNYLLRPLMVPVSTARRRLIPQPCCERCPAGAAGRVW